MEVLYDEDVASHIGPESCGAAREDRDEALTGEGAGRPLSRDRLLQRGADVVAQHGRQHGRGALLRAPVWTPRGRRPRHAWKLLVREPGDLSPDRPEYRAARVGKAGGP